VLAPVLEDVDECVPDLARSLERSHVISVGPYSPVAAQRTIDRLGDANREALNAASQSNVSVRFEKKVDVIALNAEVDDAEPVRRSFHERGSDGAEDVIAAERRQMVGRTERYVSRAPAIVHGAATMANASPGKRRLSPGAVTPPAPRRRRRKLQLPRCVFQFESGIYYSKLASMSSPDSPASRRRFRRRAVMAQCAVVPGGDTRPLVHQDWRWVEGAGIADARRERP
jgi:hypothetical protein